MTSDKNSLFPFVKNKKVHLVCQVKKGYNVGNVVACKSGELPAQKRWTCKMLGAI